MSSSTASSETRKSVALSLRCLVTADVPAVEAILLANRPVFSDEECRTAMAMVGEALERPEAEDPYQLLVAVDGGETDAGPAVNDAPHAGSRVIAYACVGMIPLTQGAYDLYWIAVHPEYQARGVGRALLQHCEEVIAAQGGRLIVVETSGRPDYERTRRFYEKTMAYETAARIRDFYRPGDDKIVYVKYLGE